ATLGTTTRYALGGPAAAADPGATPLAGADRFETSALIASTFFSSPQTIGVATGSNFPDALGAGPDLGAKQAPLLLMPSSATLSTSLAAYLTNAGATVTTGLVFGGKTAVSDATVGAAQNALFAGTL
ncbi:MAG TPA: cell wall-binding repeat-containing protein, partial [Acidothermaceae bacterium]|nr:cell wall-binding repeat-containing protein [Acidothermaceae bacterium]